MASKRKKNEFPVELAVMMSEDLDGTFFPVTAPADDFLSLTPVTGDRIAIYTLKEVKVVEIKTELRSL